eukprot:2600400-Rhodomonas_salina.1
MKENERGTKRAEQLELERSEPVTRTGPLHPCFAVVLVPARRRLPGKRRVAGHGQSCVIRPQLRPDLYPPPPPDHVPTPSCTG